MYFSFCIHPHCSQKEETEQRKISYKPCQLTRGPNGNIFAKKELHISVATQAYCHDPIQNIITHDKYIITFLGFRISHSIATGGLSSLPDGPGNPGCPLSPGCPGSPGKPW